MVRNLERRGGERSSRFRFNQPAEGLARRHKRLVICADGTWNTPYAGRRGEPTPTNVWLMHQMVRPMAADGTPQLSLYHVGVGTGGPLDRIVGGMNGFGLRRNILSCYRFLVEHYAPGDHVYLFGFSRGAYTVRSLAGLIRNCGIVNRVTHANSAMRERAIRSAWKIYRDRGDDAAPAAQRAVEFRHAHSHPDFRISCIGVWDTVGSLGIPIGGWLGWMSRQLFGFHDVKLSSRVDRAFHAVAVDEYRSPFMPTLWEQQPGAAAGGQKLEQAWFTGAHADVGGGYAWSERELANITLRWMVNRVSAECRLDLDRSALGVLAETAPAKVVLHDSRSWIYRATRLTPKTERVIDCGVTATGYRNRERVTEERVHDSVYWLREAYGEEPLPNTGAPYDPGNMKDYEHRIAMERSTPEMARPSYASDVRPGSGVPV